MKEMAELLAFLFLVTTGIAGGVGIDPRVTYATLDTILEVEDRVNITSVSEQIPIYRKDLGVNHIAYWQFIINGDAQLIVSASQLTGDYKLVFHGPLPAMTKILDHTAWENGKKCSKYYMLSADVTMMCEDSSGHLVATTRDSDIKYETSNTNDTTLKYRHLEKNYDKLDQEWEERAREVKEDGIWDDMRLVPNHDFQQDRFDNHGGLFILRRGHAVKIPVSGRETLKLLTPDQSQHKLCSLLKICTYDNRGVIDPTRSQKTSYGLSYVTLRVPESLHGEDVRFDLGAFTEDGVVIKRFYIDVNSRPKRATYTPWQVFSIPDETYFPDYNQFKLKGGCYVGCGPVAWAMIFGYFDRRSHAKPAVYGTKSQDLFRCSANGMTGSASCVAPKYNHYSMNNYLAALKGILKTICLFKNGATLQGRMDRVKGFFKARQQGRADILIHRAFLSFFGRYSDKTRDKGLAAIRAGWPVIAGVRLGGLFSQHYPVATKYRSRIKTEKKCFLRICRNKRTTQYEMYLHMGWGGRQNGWRAAKMFFAGYARY